MRIISQFVDSFFFVFVCLYLRLRVTSRVPYAASLAGSGGSGLLGQTGPGDFHAERFSEAVALWEFD